MIKIRQATPPDIPKVIELAMIIEKKMNSPILKKLGVTKTQKLFEESAAKGPNQRFGCNRTIVAEKNNQIVGIAYFYPNEDEVIIDAAFQNLLLEKQIVNEQCFPVSEVFGKELYLDTIAVDENNRNLGIGRKLIETLLPIAKRYGKNRIGLNVDKNNPKAFKLYQRLGFKEITKVQINAHEYIHMHLEI